ncbi:response regulator transcription factor [Ochrobactrum sp. XJ1]|nr:response regulator transcription factor [Ochrobactrum sp. XJ1]
MKILLVEDNGSLRELVEEHLSRNGFVVDTVSSGEDALDAVRRSDYDGMILDLGLPSVDGMKVLQRVRLDRDRALPVVIMTARDELSDRLAGLNSGADDYVVKPFDMLELEARLRAVLRRPGSRPMEVFEIGNVVIDVARNDVIIAGEIIDLSRRELTLIQELARIYPGVVAKDSLEDKLYSFDEYVTANAAEAVVSRLRKKLVSSNADIRIATVRGIGYRLMKGAEREMD